MAKWGKAKVTSAPAQLAPEPPTSKPPVVRTLLLAFAGLAVAAALAGVALTFTGYALGVGFWLAAGLVTP